MQRVTRACVVIDGREVSRVGNGFLLLVGIHKGDTPEGVDFLAAKCADIRSVRFRFIGLQTRKKLESRPAYSTKMNRTILVHFLATY